MHFLRRFMAVQRTVRPQARYIHVMTATHKKDIYKALTSLPSYTSAQFAGDGGQFINWQTEGSQIVADHVSCLLSHHRDFICSRSPP